jgi:predicted transport protein
MEAQLKQKTGKTLEQWKLVLAKQPFTKHGEYMAYLKGEHGITHGFANFITLKFRAADAGSAEPEDLLANQYKGKEHLKPIYDVISTEIAKMGGNIEVAPKKSAVSFRAKRQFALLQPSTKTRVDLGLKLNDVPHEGRLETSGPFGAMCTHRVQLHDSTDVDQQVLTWIKLAHEQAS